MQQNYIIFIKNNPLKILFDNRVGEGVWLQANFATTEYQLNENFKSALHNYLAMMMNGTLPYLDVLTTDTDALLQMVKGYFEEDIVAAGGVVFNTRNELLCIFRRGYWDLPKGKVDKGEGIEQAALREVKEETGVVHLEMGEPFAITHHCYEAWGKTAFKTTHWFVMHTIDETLQPQTEEDITQAEWVAKGQVDMVLRNTYENIKPVINKAFSL